MLTNNEVGLRYLRGCVLQEKEEIEGGLRMKVRKVLSCLAFFFASLTWVSAAQAIPAFARANDLACAACHSAFPALNETGRQFKVNGYRVDPVSISDLDKPMDHFPVSMAVVSRPYSKEKGGNKEIRAIHEAEIMAGGVLYKNLSGFLEFESEGEDGFGTIFATGAINYDAIDALHLQVAYGPSFFADPYDTLSDMRRLTVSHYDMWNSTFGNADNEEKMRHSRQQVSVFGTVGPVFYNVGYGGLTEDKVANQSSVAFGRLAVDITRDIMVGVFGLSGSCDVKEESDFSDCSASTTDMDFSRVGVDAQVDVAGVRLTGVYLQSKDEGPNGAPEESNDHSYVQAAYFGSIGEKAFVPLLRYETAESNDGQDEVKKVTTALNFYFLRNLKGTVEYSKEVSVPSGDPKDEVITAQAVVVF